MESNEDYRLFVRDGWRHYRRRYSLGEFRWGLVTLGVLGLITGWVVWMGQHPDPALYSDGAGLLVKPGGAEQITVAVSAPQLSPGTSAGSADKITYSAKNAFSLGFADDVWTVRPKGKENDLEIFVSARKDAASARQMADRLHKSSLELGQPAGKAAGVTLVKDQFLGLMSASSSIDHFAIGIRGAPDKQGAVDEIERLRTAIKGAPADLRSQARPQANESATESARSSGSEGTPAPASTREDGDEK